MAARPKPSSLEGDLQSGGGHSGAFDDLVRWAAEKSEDGLWPLQPVEFSPQPGQSLIMTGAGLGPRVSGTFCSTPSECNDNDIGSQERVLKSCHARTSASGPQPLPAQLCSEPSRRLEVLVEVQGDKVIVTRSPLSPATKCCMPRLWRRPRLAHSTQHASVALEIPVRNIAVRLDPKCMCRLELVLDKVTHVNLLGLSCSTRHLVLSFCEVGLLEELVAKLSGVRRALAQAEVEHATQQFAESVSALGARLSTEGRGSPAQSVCSSLAQIGQCAEELARCEEVLENAVCEESAATVCAMATPTRGLGCTSWDTRDPWPRTRSNSRSRMTAEGLTRTPEERTCSVVASLSASIGPQMLVSTSRTTTPSQKYRSPALLPLELLNAETSIAGEQRASQKVEIASSSVHALRQCASRSSYFRSDSAWSIHASSMRSPALAMAVSPQLHVAASKSVSVFGQSQTLGKDTHGYLVALTSICQHLDVALRMTELLSLFEAFDGLLGALGATFALGRVDFSQNLAKVREWHSAAIATGHVVDTMRAFLSYERQSGMHRPGRLADPSGANSLQWLRRSFAFVVGAVHVLANGEHDLRIAVKRSYAQELEPYHGWVLRGVFSAVFRGLPARDVFLRRLVGEEFSSEKALYELGRFAAAGKQVVEQMVKIHREFGLDDLRRV